MATKKNRGANPNPTAEDIKKSFGEDVRFKTYKNDGSGFDQFDEGEEILGVLVSIRDHSITDKRTKAPKDIRVYSIRVTIPGMGENDPPTEKVLKVGGRTILDRMFDDIMDERGGYDVQNRRYSGPGYDAIKDKMIRLNRGENAETRDGDPLGTYEVAIEE